MKGHILLYCVCILVTAPKVTGGGGGGGGGGTIKSKCMGRQRNLERGCPI